MKKFGTPIGAGPGNANENVGFDGVGTPPAPVGGGGLFAAGVLVLAGFFGFAAVCFFLGLGLGFALGGVLCVDGFWGFAGPLGCGGPDGVVVVVPVVEVVLEVVLVVVLEVVEVVPGVVVEVVPGVVVEVVLGVVVEVVLGVVVEVVDGEQDSDSFKIVPLTGTGIDESGVPGATSTVKLVVCPLAIVTVTTQVSADADGIAAMTLTASAVIRATTSFRLLNTVALLLPPSAAHAVTAATTWRREPDATDCHRAFQRRSVPWLRFRSRCRLTAGLSPQKFRIGGLQAGL
jgi:hypothetical protein